MVCTQENIHTLTHYTLKPHYRGQGYGRSEAYTGNNGYEVGIPPGMECQFITGHHEHTFIQFILRGHLASTIHLPACFWEVGRNQITWSKPMQTPREHGNLHRLQDQTDVPEAVRLPCFTLPNRPILHKYILNNPSSVHQTKQRAQYRENCHCLLPAPSSINRKL